jgi:hypothetical protein
MIDKKQYLSNVDFVDIEQENSKQTNNETAEQIIYLINTTSTIHIHSFLIFDDFILFMFVHQFVDVIYTLLFFSVRNVVRSRQIIKVQTAIFNMMAIKIQKW